MSKLVLYDFFATWCGPCRIQTPILHKVEGKFADSVDFKMVDVDENGDLTNKYQISVVPTIIIEKDGNIVFRNEGVVGEDELEHTIKSLM
ncbi:MAG TPA: thioredoxin domain-containing protein [Methanocorpusculum sp.]|nr:thioredoxin domain-containing protein [Methanocorpusculum sp.]